MDANLRYLLKVASHESDQDAIISHLQQAFEILRSIAENRPAMDAPEAFNQDLYVLCAEVAFQQQQADMSKQCLKMFFMKTPPANQFLCRAYLCQAQLLAPDSAENPEQLEKAVVYLLKAINMAKENQRYHFLVYNGSVLYWQFCRPFLKPNYRQYLARTLHQVVKALDDIEDRDQEWRAKLMIELIQCHVDAGRISDASHISTAAASFIKQNVPHLYKELFGLMVKHQLVDSTKLHKDIKTSAELSVFYRICRLKLNIANSESSVNVQEECNKIFAMIIRDDDSRDKERSLSVREGSAMKSSKSRPITPGSPSRMDDRKSPASRSRRTPTPTSSKKLSFDSPEKPFLLLELCRLCLELNQTELAQKCSEAMKTCSTKEHGFYLEAEFVQCDLMIRLLGDRQESYNKFAVDVRIQAIKKCEQAIMNAIRLGDPNIIQAGCTTQWNLCMPLLQSNLRHHVRRPLTMVAEALEDVQSLLMMLRCQVHMELSKCEEDEEQISVAMEHIKKALHLDDGNVYRERLQVFLHRLHLRSELYKQPEKAEDQAATIIEQASKAGSGTMRMKRSLLVKAGQALSPDAFLLVLESESETKEMKGVLTPIKKLSAKAQQYMKSIKKAPGHLKRLGDENDRERARLWADLAKTARKQEVWDVCRVAARFCLLYDDMRWTIAERSKSPRDKLKSTLGQVMDADNGGDKKPSSRPSSPLGSVPLYDRDLIRILAEVHFINGEALVHLLRGENVELGDSPVPPVDNRVRPKGYVATKPEDDPDWIGYVSWITYLSKEVFCSFVRAAWLGVDLRESWIVTNACVYVWNYTNHILSYNRHCEIVEPYQSLLDCLKKVGHESETTLLVNICVALAFGLIQPWIPETPAKDELLGNAPTAGKLSPKPKKAALGGNIKNKGQLTVSLDAGPDLKRALDVIEFCMKVTNGDNPTDVVPLAVRYPMLQLWVVVKQLGQSAINKTLGTDDEHNLDGQAPMTRAQVAVEILSVNNNGIFEFRDQPSITETASLMEACVWTDKLIELQLWTRLASLAYEQKDHIQVVKCANKALTFAERGTQPRGKRIDQHKYLVEHEMLAYASNSLGQSQMDNAMGKNAVRREAMVAFLNSAIFSRNAGNYELVLLAARQYWNCCLPLVSSPVERELLKEPIKNILKCLADTVDKNKIRDREEQEKNERASKLAEQEAKIKAARSQLAVAVESASSEGPNSTPSEVKPANQKMIGSPGDDLTLRAALYGVLFQSYSDKGEWEEGLKAMDQAITNMPRTKHRLLLFKHRVMVKAKLGRNVSMDIQKFKDESEDYVAHMWRKVALCSKEQLDQLACYQNAIESLNQPSSDWQKVEYLIEFGQWLYCNEFSLQDALDQIEWAVDVLLNMKFEAREVCLPRSASAKQQGKGKGKKGKGKRAKTPSFSGNAKIVNTELSCCSPDPSASVTDTETESFRASDYIPVIKEAVIGVGVGNPSLTVNDLTDIHQLDCLVICNVLLAVIGGRKSQDHPRYLISAYGYIQRIWQVTLHSAGPVMKEIAKSAALDAAEQTGKNSAKGKQKKGEEKPVKEKPKRKSPLDFFPTTVEEWAVYDAPDEIIEACRADSMKLCGVNGNSIKKPSLTLYYLNILVQEFCDMGYDHMALPILALADLLSRDVIQHRAYNAFVHLRASEICIHLNLANGVTFHECLAGPISVQENEVAKSREEVCLWKEKLAQVAKEELRIEAALKRMEDHDNLQDGIQLKNEQEEKSNGNETTLHLGQEIGLLSLREVWTDTAEVAIRLGYYQPAREMLNEALLSATAFKDSPLIGRILFNFAQLSLHEAQYGQCINLCQEAQGTYNGNEMFWYKTTALSIDAMLANYNARDNLKVARGMIVDALNTFNEVADERMNKVSITGFIMAKLEAKLGRVQAQITFSTQKDITRPKGIRALLSACQKLNHASEQLKDLNFLREYSSIKKEHAEVLVRIAKQVQDSDQKHEYFMMAQSIIQEAVQVSDSITCDLQTLTSLQQIRNISLPVQREAADVELTYAELLNDILETWMEEERVQQLEERHKGSIQKTLEEITDDSPVYSEIHKLWMQTTQVIGEQALSILTKTHNMILALPQLKARSLFNIGRCLRLLSTKNDPEPPNLWQVDEMGVIKLEQSVADCSEEAEDGRPVDNSSRHYQRQCRAITKAKVDHEVSRHYLSQANEVLVQAINLSLNHGFVDIAGKASQELLECCGQYEPGLCSQYMALFQSCQSSQYLEQLLARAQVDAVTSQQAALLHQRNNIVKNNVTTNLMMSSVYSTIKRKLENDWQAWKNITVNPMHLEVLREFPANFNFVVLQHSPDKQYLYGAIMDKPKPQPAAGGKNKGSNAQSLSKAKVMRMKTSAKTINSLVERFNQHKKDVMLFLLKQEYQRTQLALREKMLANLDQDMKEDRPQTCMSEELEDEEQALQQHFVKLVKELEVYLAPITAGLDTLFRPPTATSGTNSIPTRESLPSQEAVIMLADPLLLELPLEAMSCMQSENIASLSRDFSLQMMYHRYCQGEPVVDEAEKKAMKAAADKNKPPSRIPGLRDASKKQAKIIPLDRTAPPGCIPVDTNNFRFMVDTNQECSETEQFAPIDIFNSLINKYSQQFTTRWLGVMGNEHTPSVGEWEIYLMEGSAMIFLGMERFLSYIPPAKLVTLNVPECVALFLFDLSQTSKSFTRQSKADVLKSTDHLELERPVETIMLSSLTGVKTIVANQWHCTLEENGNKLALLMQDMLEEGKPTGHCVRLLFAPYRRKVVSMEREQDEGEDEGKDEEDKEEDIIVCSTEMNNNQVEVADTNEEEDPCCERRMSWFNTVCYGLPNIVVVQM